MVEHDAACPLEVAAFGFVLRQVDDSRDVISLRTKPVEDVVPPFQTTTGSAHRIKHHCAVVVEGYPVVGEYSVRGYWRLGILDRHDLNARCRQTFDHQIELFPGS